MRIDIIVDKTRLVREDNTSIYESDSDYFPAYIELRNAIKGNKNNKIILYSKPLQYFLFEAIKKYKKAEIHCPIIDYKSLLKAKWNIDYDIDISEDDICEDKLLDYEIKSSSIVPISSFISQNFISNYLDDSQLSLNNYGLLVSDLIKFNQKIKDLPEICSKVLVIKLNKWKKQTSSKDDIFLIESLYKIVESYENLCLFKIVRNYPIAFQNKVLSSELTNVFKRSQVNIEKLSLDSFIKNNQSNKNNFLNEMNIFFNGFLSTENIITKDSINELLKYFCGEINEEADFIISLLKANHSLIDSEIVALLLAKFSSIKDIYFKKINDLKNYISPKKPNHFNGNLSFDENVEWAVKEYLPYKYWIENSRIIEEDILIEGLKFSDYYFNKYSEISYNYENFLFRYVYNFKEEIKSTKFPIILILDNFNFKFYDLLKESFMKYRIVEGEVMPYLCMLPSITSVGKKAIISGRRDKVDINSDNYKNSFEITYKSHFPNHKINYFSKLGLLDSHNVNEKEIILINYLEIDEQLHKPYQKTAIETKAMINFFIENLTEKIYSFIKRNRIENDSKIFFVSDHGSTYILPDMKNNIDIKFFKKKNWDTSHRCISIDDKSFNELKSDNNNSENIYFLDKQISGDSNNYILAKGYNRFLEINEDYYIHGGTLPEEVIVPAGYFKYMEEEIKPIILQIIKDEYRLLTKEELILRIANPNNYTIKDITFNIINAGIQSDSFVLQIFNPFEEKNINVFIRIKDKAIKNLKISVTYFINENIFKEEFEFAITIKKAIKENLNLEDLI